MKIGIVGDTHGNSAVTLKILDELKAQDIDTIVHVGDFGFWPGKAGGLFLAQVNTHLAKNGQTLYVTPGNHEDYTFLKSLWIHEDGWGRAREHILVAPRGHRWEWDGVSFVSLGGAPSVDRAWRLKAQRAQGFPVWWKEEDITPEDMDKTISGGYADVMIAHDAPFGVPAVERGIAGNPFNFTEADLRYAYEGRLKMREVVDAVAPKFFFHGHYHFKVHEPIELDSINEDTGLPHKVQIRGLAADGAPFSNGILDLSELSFEFDVQYRGKS